MNEALQLVFVLIFVCSIIFAMISDYSQLRIPNSVSIVLLAAFIPYALLGGVSPVWPHLVVGGAVLVAMFIFFALGWLGAGDVKFLSALMLWAGPSEGVMLMLLFALFGGAFAFSLLGLRSVLQYYPILAEWPVIGKFSRWARNGLCPYGLPIGLAALCVAPSIFLIR
ncbi:MAG: pilus assembly protein CpaA [Rhodomicrobium sp.]|nr:pilus assembly protein CpaA [Rhodomicrobium sp.]